MQNATIISREESKQIDAAYLEENTGYVGAGEWLPQGIDPDVTGLTAGKTVKADEELTNQKLRHEGKYYYFTTEDDAHTYILPLMYYKGCLLYTSILCKVIFFGGGAPGMISPEGMTFGAAVELSVAMPLSWLPLISDYTREAAKPVKATAVSAIVYGIVSCWMYTIGMGAAIFTGEGNIASIMVKAGLGIAGLLIIIFSTVTTTFLDAYSAGVSSESIIEGISPKQVGIVVTVVGTVAAIAFPMDDITDFLYLIGSVFAPMIAIQIADFFLLKKDESSKAANVPNLVIWVIGFLAYRGLMHVDMPVGNTLPDMLITIVICFAVRKVALLGKNTYNVNSENP